MMGGMATWLHMKFTSKYRLRINIEWESIDKSSYHLPSFPQSELQHLLDHTSVVCQWKLYPILMHQLGYRNYATPLWISAKWYKYCVLVQEWPMHVIRFKMTISWSSKSKHFKLGGHLLKYYTLFFGFNSFR